MPALVRNLRYALRILANSPSTTAIAIATLAIGIGANTAIFSVADALLLRPLRYPQADRLVLLAAEKKAGSVREGPLTFPRFTFMQRAQAFSGIAAFTNEEFNLSGRGDPEQIHSARVSSNFFDVLGVSPRLGRTFRPDEDQPNGDPVVLISDSLRNRLFGSAEAIGQHLTLDARDYTVIGVLPRDFRFGFFGNSVDIVAPRIFDLNLITPQQVRGGSGFLRCVARLKPGTTIPQASAEMSAISAAYRAENPTMPDADPAMTVAIHDLRDELVFQVRSLVLLLFGSVGLVLLIACANVASLLLSRALGRRREIAIRTAIGANRRELILQLLTESLLLALIAGFAGIAVNWWTAPWLAAMAHDTVPRAEEIRTNLPVLAFTLVISIAAGVLFGLVPALQMSRPNLTSDLRATPGPARHMLRNLLVVAQVALSLVLSVGAGLLIRNFVQMRSASPGFDAAHLLTLRISLPPARYAEAQSLTGFYDQLLASVRTVPGVVAVAESSALPANPVRLSPALPEGQPVVPLVQRPIFNIQTISPGYVEAMRVPLLRGRQFTAADDTKAPRVVIANDTLARRYWPGDNPVGKHILVGRAATPFEVVGVIGDVPNSSLASDIQPEIFLPFAQLPWPSMFLLVRTAGNPHSVNSAVRARLGAIDPDQPVTSVATMEEVLEKAAGEPRFTTTLMGTLSAMALILAMVGIYGVISYSVAERTDEMGIRIALGAEQSGIIWLVVRQGVTLAMCGVAVGLLASIAATRLLSTMLYRVSATDPLTFAAAPLLFLAVAIAASYIPARRATRVDPMQALRHE